MLKSFSSCKAGPAFSQLALARLVIMKGDEFAKCNIGAILVRGPCSTLVSV